MHEEIEHGIIKKWEKRHTKRKRREWERKKESKETEQITNNNVIYGKNLNLLFIFVPLLQLRPRTQYKYTRIASGRV